MKWDVIVSPSLRLLMKCEFDIDVKIEQKSVTAMMESN